MYIKKNLKVTEGYKNIILGFVIVTVILVVTVVYFSASEARITITAKPTDIKTDFTSEVVADGGGNKSDMLQGMVYETEVDGELVGQATGTALLTGDAVGKVTLTNKRAEDQVLVKTTRLLSPDGVLLRLSDRVTIPANGDMEASVYADDPNTFKELAPTRLTIPGLWEGLQDLVYAENNQTIKSIGTAVKVVDEMDIEKALTALTLQLQAKATDNFRKSLNNGDFEILTLSKEKVSEEISVKAGDEASDFKVSAKYKISLLGINKDNVLKLANDKMVSMVPEGQEVKNLDYSKFTFSLQSFDPKYKTASVKIHIEGNASLKETSNIFDKGKLSGLNAKGVELYLTNFPGIEKATVEFSPFWVDKVPRMKDHIKITVEASK